MAQERERRINLRFPSGMFDQLDEKRFKARTSWQEIGFSLFEEWLLGKRPDPPPRPVPEPPDPLVEKLAVIRASGDVGLIGIVKKAVEVSYGLLQHSLTPEDIEHLKAANRDSGVAGRHSGDGSPGEEHPGAGKKRTRRSA
jgi:hypothetical protein